MTEHLGYERHERTGAANGRNGAAPKGLITEAGSVDVAVPRDRAGSFAPRIARKGQRRLDGIDMLVISLYARGMTVRGIQAHLEEIYEVDVSRGLISRITGGVLDEVKEWQARPLDPGRCSRSCSSTPSCARSASENLRRTGCTSTWPPTTARRRSPACSNWARHPRPRPR